MKLEFSKTAGKIGRQIQAWTRSLREPAAPPATSEEFRLLRCATSHHHEHTHAILRVENCPGHPPTYISTTSDHPNPLLRYGDVAAAPDMKILKIGSAPTSTGSSPHQCRSRPPIRGSLYRPPSENRATMRPQGEKWSEDEN